MATTHDWGYASGRWVFERAKVMGGCSAHNGAIAAVGQRQEYDDWGLPGWHGDDVAPLFDEVLARQAAGAMVIDARDGIAFAAGHLYALSEGMADQDAVSFALAACCLKHGIVGDWNFATAADVRTLLAASGVAAFHGLVYLGLRSTTTVNAVLLNSSIPLFMMLCSWIIERERASARLSAE